MPFNHMVSKEMRLTVGETSFAAFAWTDNVTSFSGKSQFFKIDIEKFYKTKYLIIHRDNRSSKDIDLIEIRIDIIHDTIITR